MNTKHKYDDYYSYTIELYKAKADVNGEPVDSRYIYRIYYYDDYYMCEDYITSDEWYHSEEEAANAAEEHISGRLENGEW